jgi:hypothetical protein
MQSKFSANVKKRKSQNISGFAEGVRASRQTTQPTKKQKVDEIEKELAKVKKALEETENVWEEEKKALEKLLEEERLKESTLKEERAIIWKKLCEEMEDALDKVTSTRQYRPGFPMEWSTTVGFTAGAGTLFNSPHQIRGSQKIDSRHPYQKKKAWREDQWEIILHQLATKMFTFACPKMMIGEQVFHFSKMSSDKHNVPIHVDKKDIGHQYVVHFGKWTGASLVCYEAGDETNPGEHTASFSLPYKLIKMDGRLAHQVIKDNFQGVRYTVVCYQSWNSHITKKLPIFHTPKYVE